MHNLARFSGTAAAAIAFAAFAPGAVAQDNTGTRTCQFIGSNVPEPLGDREGHSIQISQASCHIDSGPISDAIMTTTDIWEWDGTNAVLLSGSGIARKPGATLVVVATGGKLALTGTPSGC
jgi:hypothetical protein